MPVKGPSSQFEFASWSVPQLARSIEYPLEIMEEIRAFACDELLQLSHGGNEVGGVLFGTRREDLIRILTWRPIACEHAQGEGLRLSYKDRMNLAVQLEVARQNPDLKDLRPLGWFVSRARADVSMSPSDLEIFNGFFPESWQVALVICPQGSGRAQAGFFVREAGDKLMSDCSYQCFDLEPLRLSPVTSAVTSPAVAPAPSPEPKAVKPEPVETLPVAPVAPPPEPQPIPPVLPVREAAIAQPARHPDPVRREPPRKTAAWVPRDLPPEDLPDLSFEIEERLPTHERWLWAIPVVLALGIAAFMLYQRRTPDTSLALRAFNEAHTVELAWDTNSHTVRDSDHAEINISDGRKSSQISLNSDQLHAGKMSYVPQSGDIGFAMTVFPSNGEPIHESTRIIAPEPVSNAPTQPPQLIPANPPVESAPPPPPNADRDALQQKELQLQIQRLKEDLGKERARADELQNLVRILENRLGIPPERAKPGQRH